MRPIYVDAVGVETTDPVPLDVYQRPFNVTLTVAVISGVVDATVEYTTDDIWAEDYDPTTGNWQAHADLTNIAATSYGTIISPVTAVRMVNAGTGTAQLVVLQAGAV